LFDYTLTRYKLDNKYINGNRGNLGIAFFNDGYMDVEFWPLLYAKNEGQACSLLVCMDITNQKICMYEFPEVGGDGDDAIALDVTVSDAHIGTLFLVNFSKEEVEEKYIPKVIEIIKCIEYTYKTEFDNSYESFLP
jgi:hypothetical protein